jgi:protein-tyrosine phosphatase
MKDAYWIGEPRETRLAIVPRPRGLDWLEEDLLRLRRAGVDVLVSMLTHEEELELGLEREAQVAERVGLGFCSYPIPDRSTPSDLAAFQHFVHDLSATTSAGEFIGVHCRGCIGRATILSAALLIQNGWSADRALIAIESARGCSVPDTPEQRSWIQNFHAATTSAG